MAIQGPAVTCPHCGGANPLGSAFCEACGKAMPAAVASGPRIVSADGVATTGVGLTLQVDTLHKQAKKAAGALLAVAIIMTIVAIFLGYANNAGAFGGGRRGQTQQFEVDTATVIVMGILATVFWGLYFWARSQPLPAAIVGLVVYGTLLLFNVITSVSAMSEGGRGSGYGGIGIGCIDIVIVAVLIQAIGAGMKYRKLMRNSGPAFPLT